MDIPAAGHGMNVMRSIKLIKNANRKHHAVPIAVALAVDPNRWSTAVRTWVVDWQTRDRSEPLRAFDSLFNDAPPSSSPGAESGSS